MKGRDGYAVFFFPQAIEALGDAIKPYIQDSPVVGPHVPCDEVDTGGALIELTMKGRMPTGDDVTLELMVPTSMVRMIVSRQSGGMFGFGPRSYEAAAQAALPVIGASAPAAEAPAEAVPASADTASPAVTAPAEGDAAAKPAP
ncbi:hypothetical protein WCE34_11235 [Luteimonas sp. MJ204]|jgi:hypothetical protein|uniref:hypothetical protein n=1 Tax=Luteimonas sp. MJ145 TaxID=3129234 RepID=UPI0031BB7D1D